VVPWLDRLVDERGFLKVCCVAEGPANFLTDEAGRRINISDDRGQAEVGNSPRLRELRRLMLAGDWDPMCERCRASELAGGGSSRLGRNHHLRRHVPSLLADTAPDGTVTTPRIRHLDLRLGNHCNLTCRMCTPGASRLWADAYDRVQPERYRLGPERLAVLKAIDWIDDPAVWVRFRALVPDIEWLHFAGGEPMIVPAMIDALRMAVEEGCAARIHVSYNTNLTLLPRAATDLWPHFKRVSVSCSVDGYGPLNDYIRRPSRWADIDRNLRELDCHVRDWNLSEVHVATTVQIYNALDLDRLYAYLRSGFEHIRPLPALSALSWPSYLSVQALPRAVKELVRLKLQAERARPEYRTRPEIAWLLRTIDAVIAFMDARDLNGQRDDFAHFTARSDEEFGDSFRRAAPELAALLDAGR
jgi:MoaA/NifB/PqqE/SkfB family radical SAM enzyme